MEIEKCKCQDCGRIARIVVHYEDEDNFCKCKKIFTEDKLITRLIS